MNTADMAKALMGVARRCPGVNHQENQLIKDAAMELLRLDKDKENLIREVEDLRERIAIMTETGDEPIDPEWPPIDDTDEPDTTWDDPEPAWSACDGE